MTRLTHAEMLPAIRAENEAWRAKHLPLLRARQAQRDADRAQAVDLTHRGLKAINATESEVALVARVTGFIL